MRRERKKNELVDRREFSSAELLRKRPTEIKGKKKKKIQRDSREKGLKSRVGRESRYKKMKPHFLLLFRPFLTGHVHGVLCGYKNKQIFLMHHFTREEIKSVRDLRNHRDFWV